MRQEAYTQLVATLREHVDLAAALHLLEWDQETYMPAGVVDSRARQIGTLAALLH
jgi:carboxypeptidase Taq